MRLDDACGDRQADAHALRLGRDEGLEQLLGHLRREPGPVSATLTSTMPSPAAVVADHAARAARSRSIASMALRIRLSSTCWIWTWSTSTEVGGD